jgi:hypothetical protein
MLLIRAFIAVRLRIFIPFKTDALVIAFLLILFLALPLVLCPLLVVMVSRHVRACTMVRTPLQSRTRLVAFDCVPDFGVPPVLAALSFLASLVGLLWILAFITSLQIIIFELLLKIRNLGGEGNDLGIRSTGFFQLPSATILR